MKDYQFDRSFISEGGFLAVYDELPLWSAPFGLTLLENVPMHKNMVALDLGCGTGFLTLELAGRLGKSSQVIAIDTWDPGIKKLMDKAGIMGINNIRAFQAEAENMLFKENFFDLIVSNNGLNNCRDLNQAVRECHRTLKEGGILALTQNLPGTMVEFYNIYKDLLRSIHKIEEIEKTDRHINDLRKSVDEMKEIISNAGLITEKIIEKEFSYRFSDGSAMLDYFFFKTAFVTNWQSVLNKVEINKVFAKLEEKLNEYADSNGEIKLTIPYFYMEAVKK